jgi:hypothetical protein
MVIAKDLERHDEIERMIEEGFAINQVKVTEIEDDHLISLVSLWRVKNIEEKKSYRVSDRKHNNPPPPSTLFNYGTKTTRLAT